MTLLASRLATNVLNITVLFIEEYLTKYIAEPTLMCISKKYCGFGYPSKMYVYVKKLSI